jgi:hypothetical protein
MVALCGGFCVVTLFDVLCGVRVWCGVYSMFVLRPDVVALCGVLCGLVLSCVVW